MRRRKLTAAQIAAMLRDVERGWSPMEICVQYGIGISTFYELKGLYASAPVELIARMEKMAQENTRLCRRIVQLEEEVAMMTAALKSYAKTSDQRRAAVAWLVDNYRIALSRACRLVGISRSFFLYQSSRKLLYTQRTPEKKRELEQQAHSGC
ncbi:MULTISPECIES: transposase [Achromobacter]|uniref:transposase n=1 Tax=Achromobacter TaxID=222 RepID=UPI0015836D89|nr:transposase [Achromobacter dolens]